jgi:hypothetical protein
MAGDPGELKRQYFRPRQAAPGWEFAKPMRLTKFADHKWAGGARFARRGLLLAALLSALLAGGCHTARVVRANPSFTRMNLEGGGLAIGAVTALGGGEYVAAEALAEKVAGQFVAARPWLKIVPLEETRAAFPAGGHAELMRQMAGAGRWDDPDFRAFRCVSNRARYVLVVDVAQSKDQRMAAVNYHDDLASHAMRSPLDYDVVVGGTREAALVFYLYDTARDQVVWVVTGSATLRALSRQSAYKSIYDPIAPPGTPSVVEVGGVIAKAAARALPR